MNVSYPYLAVCLLAASIQLSETTIYFWGVCVLLAWGLWPHRPVRFGLAKFRKGGFPVALVAAQKIVTSTDCQAHEPVLERRFASETFLTPTPSKAIIVPPGAD